MQHALARLGIAALVAGGAVDGHAAPEPVAEPVAAPAAEPTPIYVVEAAGTDPQLLAALAAARSNLQGQGVVLTVATLRPDETAAGRARALVAGGLARGVFWFDERTPGEIRVFMLDADGSAYVRRVPVDPQTAEASREAVWLIVESSSLALVAGQEVAMEQAAEVLEPEPAVEPAVEPAPSPDPVASSEPAAIAPPRRLAVRLGLGYLGDGLAPTIPWQSGAGLDGALDLGRHWRLSLGYGLLLPWRRDDPPVTWRHRVELRAGLRGRVGARVELYGLLGGAVEAVRWRSSTGDGGGTRVLGLGTLDGGLGVRLVANLWLVLEPGVGVLVNRFDFVECAAGATRCDGMLRRVALAPWRVRPRARLGLAVSF
jgi:hypothetical protein